MWVLRRILADETMHDKVSPWRGCLHVDPYGKAWWATDLARPTQFDSASGAEEYAEIVRIDFPRSEIRVAVYEEVFQKPLPIPAPDTVKVVARTEVRDWNWNNDDVEDDIPF